MIVGALVIFGETFNVSSLDISTAATMLLAIVGFMILYQISKPMDLIRWIIWGISLSLIHIFLPHKKMALSSQETKWM